MERQSKKAWTAFKRLLTRCERVGMCHPTDNPQAMLQRWRPVVYHVWLLHKKVLPAHGVPGKDLMGIDNVAFRANWHWRARYLHLYLTYKKILIQQYLFILRFAVEKHILVSKVQTFISPVMVLFWKTVTKWQSYEPLCWGQQTTQQHLGKAEPQIHYQLKWHNQKIHCPGMPGASKHTDGNVGIDHATKPK